MLLTILELRNRMLNCKPTATISIEFCEDDSVKLVWNWVGDGGEPLQLAVICEVGQISTSSRVFERQMHKAKRFLKHNSGVSHG